MTRQTYKCKCGTIEVRRSMSEAPLNRKCNKCHHEYKQTYHSPTLVNLIGFAELSRRNAVEILEGDI